MSSGFKAKDLNYDSTQPTFLRRLRGEISGGGDSDRHERPIARPKRAREDNIDDGPTYVLEESNQTLSKAEYEALLTSKDPDQKSGTPGGDGLREVVTTDSEVRPKFADQNRLQGMKGMTEAGKVGKKKRAIKVVGDSDDEAVEVNVKESRSGKKVKTKAKAIKLSFGEEEVRE